MFKKELDAAMAGDNCGVLLRGVKRDEIKRGMVLAKPGTATSHKKFLASMYILTAEEGGRSTPFGEGYKPQCFFRTNDVTTSFSSQKVKVLTTPKWLCQVTTLKWSVN